MLISLFGIIFLISLCVYYSINNGKLDYKSGLLWIAIIITIYGIFALLTFFHSELMQLTITHNEISVRHLLTGKITLFNFGEIIDFKTRNITTSRGEGISDGYYELTIEFTNERFITLSEDQFANYKELKNNIYLGWRNAHKK
jgi:hypothetical protein